MLLCFFSCSLCKGRTLYSVVRDAKVVLDVNKTRQIAQEMVKVRLAKTVTRSIHHLYRLSLLGSRRVLEPIPAISSWDRKHPWDRCSVHQRAVYQMSFIIDFHIAKYSFKNKVVLENVYLCTLHKAVFLCIRGWVIYMPKESFTKTWSRRMYSMTMGKLSSQILACSPYLAFYKRAGTLIITQILTS